MTVEEVCERYEHRWPSSLPALVMVHPSEFRELMDSIAVRAHVWVQLESPDGRISRRCLRIATYPGEVLVTADAATAPGVVREVAR